MTGCLHFVFLCLALSSIATATAKSVRPDTATRGTRHRHRGSNHGHSEGHAEGPFKETRYPLADAKSEARAASTTVVPLTYGNGPIFTNGVEIYLVWYGNWNQETANASSKIILRKFIASLGPKAPLRRDVNTVRGWFGTLLPYYQLDGSHVSPQIRLAGELTDHYSSGTTIGPNYQPILNNAYTKYPRDPNGIYFILPSPDLQVCLLISPARTSFVSHGPFPKSTRHHKEIYPQTASQ